jgi:hypothetical protein
MKHEDIQAACRALLDTLMVATTGAIAMAATATGYTRTTGSFLDDGFAAGMEITPSGFTSNPVDTIKLVSATVITTVSARSAQASGAGRTLSVLRPSRVLEENEALEAEPFHPYLEEQYLPGPSALPTIGPNGIATLEPQYSPRIFVPKGWGKTAAVRYADATLALFPMKLRITLPTGTPNDACRVRGDVGPFRSQLLQNSKGTHATIATTIPLRVFTINPI